VRQGQNQEGNAAFPSVPVSSLCVRPADLPYSGDPGSQGKGGMKIQAVVPVRDREPVVPDVRQFSELSDGKSGRIFTSYSNDPANAWNVNLNNGNVNNDDKTDSRYVWPVRGGE